MLQIKGRINENGELETELPPDVISGDVIVTIEYNAAGDTPEPAVVWTQEELSELMKPGERLTGHEIVKWLTENRPTGWEHIKDGAEWSQQQREKHKQRW